MCTRIIFERLLGHRLPSWLDSTLVHPCAELLCAVSCRGQLAKSWLKFCNECEVYTKCCHDHTSIVRQPPSGTMNACFHCSARLYSQEVM